MGEDPVNERTPILTKRHFGLSLKVKFFYSIGHVLNDLSGIMWFSYFLLFNHRVLHILDVYSGLLLLIGQLADAFSTVFVGLLSDKDCRINCLSNYGKRKTWHLIGCICVSTGYPLIFSDAIIKYTQNSKATMWILYIIVLTIGQFGWAAIQISHLSLIPDLTQCPDERTELNAYRYACTVISNLIASLVTWLILSEKNGNTELGPEDVNRFTNIVLINTGIGIFFAIMFHVFTKEKNFVNCKYCIDVEVVKNNSQHNKTWKNWLKESVFYRIALLYVGTRLFTNITISYLALYCQETLKLPSESVAYIPLLSYGSGFVASLSIKFVSSKLGKKVIFVVSCFVGLVASIFFYFGEQSAFGFFTIYLVSTILGIGNSAMLVTALGLINDMIGNNTKSSAFVFGSMSFLDKFTNGLAIMVIQSYSPCITPCFQSATYYRNIMSYVSGSTIGLNIIAIISLIPVKFDSMALSSESY